MANRLPVWVVCAGSLVWCLPAAGAEPRHELKGGEWVRLPAPAEGTPEGELALIRKHLAGHEPKKALKAAEKFLERYPNDGSAEEVMVLAAQAEMDRGRYYKAFERFERQLQRYPNGRFFERVLSREFEIADAFLLGRKRVFAGFLRISGEDDGLEILVRIAEHAPRTAIAEESLLRIAKHYFARGQYAEAADAYDTYLEQFDRSEHAPRAMLMAARAALYAFRGPAYDETPLLEANERFKILAERFPDQAVKARVDEVLAQISTLRAEKKYRTAGFYERVGRPRAAAFYYRLVTREYPQTQWAKEAQAGLVRLGQAGAAERRSGALKKAAVNPQSVGGAKPGDSNPK